jgi:hypothetical protein
MPSVVATCCIIAGREKRAGAVPFVQQQGPVAILLRSTRDVQLVSMRNKCGIKYLRKESSADRQGDNLPAGDASANRAVSVHPQDRK